MLQWTNDSLREAEWAHIFIHMGTGWEVPLWPCDVTWLALYWKFPVEENNRAEIKKCIFRIESILTCEQLIWTSQQLLQSSTRPSNTFHMSCWAIWHREILILPPPVLAVHDRLAHHRATPHCEATFKYTHTPVTCLCLVTLFSVCEAAITCFLSTQCGKRNEMLFYLLTYIA